jgi:hypothetical protein
MSKHNINAVMAQGMGHFLGSGTVIVFALESSGWRRQAATRRVIEVERLRIFAPVGMDIEVTWNAEENEIIGE